MTLYALCPLVFRNHNVRQNEDRDRILQLVDQLLDDDIPMTTMTGHDDQEYDPHHEKSPMVITKKVTLLPHGL
jgi:hypothetical protein